MLSLSGYRTMRLLQKLAGVRLEQRPIPRGRDRCWDNVRDTDCGCSSWICLRAF